MIEGAAKAIEFYKKAFGATERLCMKQHNGLVGHAEIEIGDSFIMMAHENPRIDALAPPHDGGSPVSSLIYTEDCDRMAGVVDPFGYKWFIATHIKDVSTEELEKGP